MSKYIKLEDAISEADRLLGMVLDTDFNEGVEHGILTIKFALLDLPTIDVSEDCSDRKRFIEVLEATANIWEEQGEDILARGLITARLIANDAPSVIPRLDKEDLPRVVPKDHSGESTEMVGEQVKGECENCIWNVCNYNKIDREVSEDNQVLYGTDHNCILTMFGECSYDKTGCGSCAVAEKIRKALSDETSEDCSDYYKGYCIRYDDGCFHQCEEAPRWIADRYCSECEWDKSNADYTSGWAENYCPNCGAKMKG